MNNTHIHFPHYIIIVLKAILKLKKCRVDHLKSLTEGTVQGNNNGLAGCSQASWGWSVRCVWSCYPNHENWERIHCPQENTPFCLRSSEVSISCIRKKTFSLCSFIPNPKFHFISYKRRFKGLHITFFIKIYMPITG